MSPAINPVVPSIPNINLSGPGATSPASGVATCPPDSTFACSGPWFIETQDMSVQYVRVPVYGVSATSHSLTQPTQSYKVGYTYMQSVTTAHYGVEKSYDNFTVSSFTQPQTFEWFPASSDSYGNTYGVVGVSALGPAGNVQTKQRWYHRRLWDSATDSSASLTFTGGRSYEIQDLYTGPTTIDFWYRSLTNGEFGDFKQGRPPQYDGTFLDRGDWYRTPGGHHDYQLGHQYNTNQENPTNIKNYVDGLGLAITNSEYWPVGWAAQTIPEPMDEGMSQYSINRHEWS